MRVFSLRKSSNMKKTNCYTLDRMALLPDRLKRSGYPR